jgi:hypothetical protein
MTLSEDALCKGGMALPKARSDHELAAQAGRAGWPRILVIHRGAATQLEEKPPVTHAGGLIC